MLLFSLWGSLRGVDVEKLGVGRPLGNRGGAAVADVKQEM